MATATARTSTRAARTVTREELEDPLVAEKVNADIQSVLSDAAKVEIPVIPLPPDDMVDLPGGLIYKNQLITTAQVRELNGRDEEALARASQSGNPFHFIDRMLRCGVVRIGDRPESETDSLLGKMLIGDREALILGIRKATYGEDIEIPDWKCPSCTSEATLTMQLSDIPVETLANPEEEIEFDVPLKNGASAHCRLASGEDQLAIYDKQDLTQAQRETILISRCVEYLEDGSGFVSYMQSKPSMALELSMPDRHAIVNAVNDRQPGPKYNQIKYKCEACGEESMIMVNIGHLFLDIGWF